MKLALTSLGVAEVGSAKYYRAQMLDKFGEDRENADEVDPFDADANSTLQRDTKFRNFGVRKEWPVGYFAQTGKTLDALRTKALTPTT